jgi:hypothetical protein
MDTVTGQFFNKQYTVAAGETQVWYPPLRYRDVTITILPGVGATGDVKFSTDPQATVESGTGITWSALHADLTDQTADSSRILDAPVTALLLSSTTAETVFQLHARPLP